MGHGGKKHPASILWVKYSLASFRSSPSSMALSCKNNGNNQQEQRNFPIRGSSIEEGVSSGGRKEANLGHATYKNKNF